MSFFDRFRRRPRSGPEAASAKTLSELREFITSSDGVEGYVEPPTSVYAMTLCLVAASGEYIRRPVKSHKQAKALCGEHGVPLYDARIVGYPRRMRDYERGVRRERIDLDDLPPLEVIDRPQPRRETRDD